MDDDIPLELDDTGFADEDDSWAGELSRAPSELECAGLNFVSSLVLDAHRLRTRVLDVLVDLSIDREQAAARLERCAADLGAGAPQDRLRDAAVRARTNVGATQVRWQKVAAIDLGVPRPIS